MCTYNNVYKVDDIKIYNIYRVNKSRFYERCSYYGSGACG